MSEILSDFDRSVIGDIIGVAAITITTIIVLWLPELLVG